MSGHSHAKTIAHAKSITDQKRGQVFSKMARLISIAVKESGANPETNSKLKTAIDRARAFNMPNDNIERAIKQAIGGQEGKSLEEFVFEGYGPGGIALLIEGITDNKNRVLGEIRQLLNQNQSKLVGEGAVRWLFDRKGVIVIDLQKQIVDRQDKEMIELEAIEAGADNLSWSENLLEIDLSPDSLQKSKGFLENRGLKIESATIDWVAKEEIVAPAAEAQAAKRLFELLDDNNDVQDVFSNLKDQ
jgi:YebC/PmpR family DNA-binding regulatory protein